MINFLQKLLVGKKWDGSNPNTIVIHHHDSALNHGGAGIPEEFPCRGQIYHIYNKKHENLKKNPISEAFCNLHF